MRVIIQRVSSASVVVGGSTVSSIGRGLLVLVGIARDDTQQDAEHLQRKILGARLWDSDAGKSWDCNVVQKAYEILLVSQFTLYGFMKGNKPDFHLAMASSESRDFYHRFVQLVRDSYVAERVKDGEFGAMMEVNLVNDGPVTLQLDSRKFTYTDDNKESQAATPSPKPKKED